LRRLIPQLQLSNFALGDIVCTKQLTNALLTEMVSILSDTLAEQLTVTGRAVWLFLRFIGHSNGSVGPESSGPLIGAMMAAKEMFVCLDAVIEKASA
jgi:hypothetical protein